MDQLCAAFMVQHVAKGRSKWRSDPPPRGASSAPFEAVTAHARVARSADFVLDSVLSFLAH
jgi:hypothetical protein